MPTNRLSLEQLVSYFSNSLHLRRPDSGGRHGDSLRIEAKADDTLSGFYHPWHPLPFPVIGPQEIGHIRPQSLDTISRAGCLIISNGLEPPPFLADAQIPLLLTETAGNQVVAQLLETLPQLVFQKHVVHGVFMAIHYQGILITGAPGSGKSELALSLLQRGHRLIADDAPEFLAQTSGEIIGYCPENLFGFLHSRNLGMIDIKDCFAATACLKRFKLDGFVNLSQENNVHPEHWLEPRRQRMLLNTAFPEQVIAGNAPTDSATLVETFAKQLAMNSQGQAAASVLFSRQLTQSLSVSD